jgi:hypothetical protein
MDQSEVAAQALHRAAVRANSRALVVASIELQQESRAAIETSKARVARSRIELSRLHETCRIFAITRALTRAARSETTGGTMAGRAA